MRIGHETLYGREPLILRRYFNITVNASYIRISNSDRAKMEAYKHQIHQLISKEKLDLKKAVLCTFCMLEHFKELPSPTVFDGVSQTELHGSGALVLVAVCSSWWHSVL